MKKKQKIDLNKYLDVFKNTKILAIIGLVLATMGLFLPYYKFTMSTVVKSVSFWKYFESKIMLLLLIVNSILIFNEKLGKIFPKLSNTDAWKVILKLDNPKFTLIPTGLYVLYTFYCISTYGVDSASATVKYTLGAYILWLGVVLLLGYGLLYKQKKIEDVEVQETDNVVSEGISTQDEVDSVLSINNNMDSLGNGIVLGFAPQKNDVENNTNLKEDIANAEITDNNIEQFEDVITISDSSIQDNKIDTYSFETQNDFLNDVQNNNSNMNLSANKEVGIIDNNSNNLAANEIVSNENVVVNSESFKEGTRENPTYGNKYNIPFYVPEEDQKPLDDTINNEVSNVSEQSSNSKFFYNNEMNNNASQLQNNDILENSDSIFEDNKKCNSCGAIYHISLNKCPNCGAQN